MAKLVIPYKPQPRQSIYHKAKADEILYGGAAGGGKSEATIMDAFKYAMQYPGSKQIIFRRTFPDLQRSIINRTLQVYPKDLARYHSQSHTWRFVTGSTVELAYWDNDKNYMNYQGAEYDCIRWEELTQFEEKWYLYMLSRLRGANPYPKQVKSTSNPGGIGHVWVKKRFIEVGPAEQLHNIPKTDDNGNQLYHPQTREPVMTSVMFIPANVYDNPALLQNDPGYLLRLLSLPDQERKQLLEGDWDSFAGQFFSEWRRDIHVIKPFTIPDHWTKIRAIDDGYAKPFACLWLAFDEEGNCYLYRTLKQTRLLSKEQAELIKQRTPENERIQYSVADTAMWTKSRDTGISPAEVYAMNGVPLIQSTKERVNGWKRVRGYLKVYRSRHQTTGEEYETVSLFVFDTCTDVIKDLPSLIHDKNDPEDLDSNGDDHIADALRYGLMSRPPRTQELPKAPDPITPYTLFGPHTEFNQNQYDPTMGEFF